VIPKRDVAETMERYTEEIKAKDLEQIAVVKAKSIKHLVAYDRDFEPFEEYVTPKQFLQETSEPVADTPY
jgi:predicted nucleic acid-binding protein